MSKIDEVKKMMAFGDSFHACDVGQITEDYVYLESWGEYVKKRDFDLIAELIANDGYDISGFALHEIPHPKVFCFGNSDTDQYFDVVKFWDDKWQFSYLESSESGLQNKPAKSIQEAVEKYEFD